MKAGDIIRRKDIPTIQARIALMDIGTGLLDTELFEYYAIWLPFVYGIASDPV